MSLPFAISIAGRDKHKKFYLAVNFWADHTGNLDVPNQFTSGAVFILATRLGYFVHVVRIPGHGQANRNRWIPGGVFAACPICRAVSSAASKIRLKRVHRFRVSGFLPVFILKQS